MGVNIVLAAPCEMSGSINLPGFPPTLVATLDTNGKADVLDQPDDEPMLDERLFLYAYSGVGFIDYRGKNRHLSGQYGFYYRVQDGTYECVKCGAAVISPPTWPFERCTHWKSGYHELAIDLTPEIMEVGRKAMQRA